MAVTKTTLTLDSYLYIHGVFVVHYVCIESCADVTDLKGHLL